MTIGQNMTTKNKDFLEWLVKRLANKYHEDDIIVKQLNSIRNDFFIVPKKISISLKIGRAHV